MSSIGIAVVGAGAWGSQVIRAMASTPGCLLRWICDRDPVSLARMGGIYGGVALAAGLDEALEDPAVDAVVIAATAADHYALARQALKAGRHVLVEKPLALRVSDATELCALAGKARRTLMVGHLLVYDPAIMLARTTIEGGELGDILMLHSQRTNLGTIRRGESAWWSLAPHDVAIALYLLGAVPTEVSATGAGFVQRQRGVEDVVFASLRFAGGALAHIHVSWLDPPNSGSRSSIAASATRRLAATRLTTWFRFIAGKSTRRRCRPRIPYRSSAPTSSSVCARAEGRVATARRGWRWCACWRRDSGRSRPVARRRRWDELLGSPVGGR